MFKSLILRAKPYEQKALLPPRYFLFVFKLIEILRFNPVVVAGNLTASPSSGDPNLSLFLIFHHLPTFLPLIGAQLIFRDLRMNPFLAHLQLIFRDLSAKFIVGHVW